MQPCLLADTSKAHACQTTQQRNKTRAPPPFLPLPQRPALRKEHWRRSSPFFSLTRSHAQLAVADEEVFQS